MIITHSALLTLNACTDIAQHLIDSGYDGLTRRQFIQKLQQDAAAGIEPAWYVDWANTYFYGGDAISKLGEFTRTQRYMIYGENISDNSTVFTDLQQAISAIHEKQAEYMANDAWMFHVQAKCPCHEEGQAPDAHTLHNCDLNGDGTVEHPVDCYQVFNYKTGMYEEFATFLLAKSRCEQLQFERCAETCEAYYIMEEVQQINDPEDNPIGWTFCNVGDALTHK